MDKDDKEFIKQLFQSRELMLSVAKDRGFSVPEELKIDFKTFLEWSSSFGVKDIEDNIDLIFENKLNNKKLLVVWVKVSLAIPSFLEKLKVRLVEGGFTQCIIVIHKKTNKITELKLKNILINSYQFEETQYNIFDHYLVPPHFICSNSEKLLIEKKYGKDNLQRINLTDTPVRHIGGRRGQLIKIIRKSQTNPNETVINYRLVK